jgi:hypothetical protein
LDDEQNEDPAVDFIGWASDQVVDLLAEGITPSPTLVTQNDAGERKFGRFTLFESDPEAIEAARRFAKKSLPDIAYAALLYCVVTTGGETRDPAFVVEFQQRENPHSIVLLQKYMPKGETNEMEIVGESVVLETEAPALLPE